MTRAVQHAAREANELWHRGVVTSRCWSALLVVAGCSFTPAAGAGDASVDGKPGPDMFVFHDAPPAMVRFIASTSGAVAPWGNAVVSYGLPLSPDPVGGDVLAVYLTFDGRVNLMSLADSAGNTYAIVQSITDSTNQQKAVVAWARVAGTGATTVTPTFDNNGCCNAIIVHELRGVSTATPLDDHAGQFQSSTGTGTDAVSSGNATTHVPYAYLFAGTTNSSNTGGESISPGTGETVREALKPPSGNVTSSEDRVVAAPGQVASTFTFSKSGTALTLEMAFEP
jgi:hypothetical protein